MICWGMFDDTNDSETHTLAYILEHREQKLSFHHCRNCFIRESGGIAEGGMVGGVLSLKEIVNGLECVRVCVCVCPLELSVITLLESLFCFFHCFQEMSM